MIAIRTLFSVVILIGFFASGCSRNDSAKDLKANSTAQSETSQETQSEQQPAMEVVKPESSSETDTENPVATVEKTTAPAPVKTAESGTDSDEPTESETAGVEMSLNSATGESVEAGDSAENANQTETTGKALPQPAMNEAESETSEPTTGWTRGPSPEDIAEKAFLPPPGATSLSKEGRLWIDPKQKRVYIDGYVAMTRGPLEMFACPVGTKEHESIVAALSRSRDVHAALLAVEASPGTPVRFRPEFVPPTGQVIRVWVCWYDADGAFKTADAREWIHDLDTNASMKTEWVFAGSGFWQDPEDKREYYEADAGDMICVSNFSSAMLDVAISSSADADSLRFEPFEAKIPARDTPVRMVLVPVPNPSDDADPNAETPDQVRPTADDVPRSPDASKSEDEGDNS
ncbi:YdjY domain-containing protein [Stieleria sp. JC731]|uniref:YdjY domain-containing protein n=1 Tax=Pirellulaceae TaxID=2691357 RepID=UPI001E40AC08|nr:YdjY domain-containing protein [Stieleria sp. JC731]MCC9600040.1 YdjY domain-containing protein [Stieleria sp. JC731]